VVDATIGKVADERHIVLRGGWFALLFYECIPILRRNRSLIMCLGIDASTTCLTKRCFVVEAVACECVDAAGGGAAVESVGLESMVLAAHVLAL
jgi:hypothetical protein